MNTTGPEQVIERYEKRLAELERSMGDLSSEVRVILQAARIGPDLSLHKIRKVCEEILLRVRKLNGVGEEAITNRPTIERMRGPLVNRGILDRVTNAHVEAIMSFANPASHAATDRFTIKEFVPAFESLLALTEWLFRTFPDNHGEKVLGEHSIKTAVPYSSRLLATWVSELRAGHLNVTMDCCKEVAIQDLRAVLETVLRELGYGAQCVDDAGVALVELAHNVGAHTDMPHGLVEISINTDLHRFTVSVSSKGPPFTLEGALSKYKRLSDEQLEIHGFGNLLLRGEISVSSDWTVNTVTFDSWLVPHSSIDHRCVLLGRDKSRFLIGERYFTRPQWIILAFDFFGERKGKITYLSRAPLPPEFLMSERRFFEYLVTQIDEYARMRRSKKIKIVDRPDKTTMKWDSVSAEISFSKFEQQIKLSDRFRVSLGDVKQDGWFSRLYKGLRSRLR